VFLSDLQIVFESANLNGLETVSICIEEQLNIYLKLFALLYSFWRYRPNGWKLQTILNKFCEYCNTWRIKANT
jgi:hypothetical protein